MSEWKEYRLGDIADCSLGKMLDQRKNRGIPRRYLNNVSLRWGAFNLDNTQTMLFEDSELERFQIKKNDIVMCEGGEPGRCAVWTDKSPICYQKALHRIRVKEGFDNWFVYYYLRQFVLSGKAKAFFSGTTILHLPLQALKSLEIKAPEIEEQRRIASILSSLDDKIAVNRRICENLEAQAQALFKHWFIDFAPFKDGKFVESELGMIPEGWRVGTLGEIADLIKPTIKPKENVEYSHYSIPAFDNNQTPSREYGDSIKSNKFAIQDSVTMLSKLNPEHKRIWFVDKVGCNPICSTEFLPFYAEDKKQSVFVYCYLNCMQNYREIANGAKGTTNSHQRIDANAILTRKLAYNYDAISLFCELVGDFMKQNENAIEESLRLSTLRDTLLPKLMSGEIKL